jgi:hypothetical protein
MTMDRNLMEFERGTRELLNDSADGLDGHVRSRLTQARFAAVQEARKQRMPLFWRGWVPVGAAAGAAALGILLWTGSGKTPHAPATTPLDDVDLMTADDSLEMIEELEFYAWLPQDDVNAKS